VKASHAVAFGKAEPLAFASLWLSSESDQYTPGTSRAVFLA
jgi:hypothetical protein